MANLETFYPDYAPPSLEAMRLAGERTKDYILRTPTIEWRDELVARDFGAGARVMLKLELLQRTGTFKPRGALNTMLTQDLSAAGVTAVSAGNHAIAVAYAAKALGAAAKIVMVATGNPARRAAAIAYGAELVIADTPASAFEKVAQITKDEGRTFIHPFEGPRVAEGTGNVGVEFYEDAGDLDAVVVAIGGGGLCSGVAAAVKQINPDCAVYGVEPAGANNMRRSLDAGSPQKMDRIDTIADSLAPPMTTPYVFDTCRRFVDDVAIVSDDEIAAAAHLLFQRAKLAVEPAAAAGLAASLGPLRARLQDKRIGLVICGSNIDMASFSVLMERGENALKRGVLAQ